MAASQTVGNRAQNLLIPSRFQIVIPRISNTVFYLSSVDIPQVELTENQQATQFNTLPVPGDRIIWGPLNFRFLMDVNLSGWWDIYNWMVGLGRPVNAQQYADLAANSVVGGATTYGVRPPYSDVILNIYSSKNNPIWVYTFVDAFPVSLDPIPLSYKDNADHVLECGVTMRYAYYNFQSYSSTEGFSN